MSQETSPFRILGIRSIQPGAMGLDVMSKLAELLGSELPLRPLRLDEEIVFFPNGTSADPHIDLPLQASGGGAMINIWVDGLDALRVHLEERKMVLSKGLPSARIRYEYFDLDLLLLEIYATARFTQAEDHVLNAFH